MPERDPIATVAAALRSVNRHLIRLQGASGRHARLERSAGRDGIRLAFAWVALLRELRTSPREPYERGFARLAPIGFGHAMTMVESPSLPSQRRRRAANSRRTRANPSQLMLSGAVALTAVLSAAVVGRLVDTGKTRGFDRICRRRMRRRRSDSLTRAAAIATGFGEPVVQLPLSILVGLALARRTGVRDGRGRGDAL